MLITIRYNKKKYSFIIKINSFVFYIHKIRKLKKTSKINLSVLVYNYILVLKILRQFGLLKPIINLNDYYY